MTCRLLWARTPLLAVVLAVALAEPALAICGDSGIYPERKTVRAGDTLPIRVFGGVPYSCSEGGRPGETGPPIAVRIYLDRPGSRIEVGRISQSTFSQQTVVRIPPHTSLGSWSLRSSSGLVSPTPIRVIRRTQLPRTGAAPAAGLVAVGLWLIVAGAHLVTAGAHRP